MEYANREYERISRKYSKLFRQRSTREVGANGTIFQYIRQAKSTDTREEQKKNAKKSIVDYVVFFNQCGMKETFESVDNMDTDVLYMTYETLVEQKYQEMLQAESNGKI